MDELPSTEFRKTFARLKEQTLVTVNGHPIGTWCPGTLPPVNRIDVYLPEPMGTDGLLPEERAVNRGAAQTQAQRDDLLRKINKSK